MKYHVTGYYLRRINFVGIVEAEDEVDAEDCAECRDFLEVEEEETNDYEFNPETTERIKE